MILSGKTLESFIEQMEVAKRHSIDFSKEVDNMKNIIEKSKTHIINKYREIEDYQFKEEDIKHGDWVYTPNEVFGSGGKCHNVFQYDERINYSTDFSNHLIFYKLEINPHSNKKHFYKTFVIEFKKEYEELKDLQKEFIDFLNKQRNIKSRFKYGRMIYGYYHFNIGKEIAWYNTYGEPNTTHITLQEWKDITW